MLFPSGYGERRGVRGTKEVVVAFMKTNPKTRSLVAMGKRELLGRTSVIVCTNSLIGPKLLGLYGRRYRVCGDTGVALRRILRMVMGKRKSKGRVMHLRAKSPYLCNTVQRRVSRLGRLRVPCRSYPNIDSFYKTTTTLRTRCALPKVSRSIIVAEVTKEAPIPRGRSIEDFTTRRTAVILFLDAKLLGRLSTRLVRNKCDRSAPTTVICGTA